MPICIECRYPVSTLYTTYSKADDKALGKGVRLTQCPRCKRFADKYVEHDLVVLFIDLVLIKPQSQRWLDNIVYRHLLFNHLGREDSKFDPSIIRFGTLLLLFDVYLTWARIEKATPAASSFPLSTSQPSPLLPPNGVVNGSLGQTNGTGISALNGTDNADAEAGFLATQPILLQYLFFVVLCAVEALSFHLPIRVLLSLRLPSPLRKIIPYYPHSTLVSTAILVSSFTKLFPILLLVWQYDLPSSASAVSWAVIINNVAALEILLDCGYLRAGLLCAVGAICRAAVGWVILRAVGIGGGAAAAGVVETGDLIEVWRRLRSSF